MRRTLMALICSLLLAPTAAHGETVVDYCAKKSTAKIHAITSGKCTTAEWSLGVAAIERGKARPSALRPEVNRRFKAARVAAAKKRYTLAITSGYRSYSAQKALFDRKVRAYESSKCNTKCATKKASRWILPPSKSNHPWGLALDINYGSGSRKAVTWLETNGYKYGLCRRYDNEWWHFEPLVAPGTKCPAREAYPS